MRDRACPDWSRPCLGRNRTAHFIVATETPSVNFVSTSKLQVGRTCSSPDSANTIPSPRLVREPRTNSFSAGRKPNRRHSQVHWVPVRRCGSRSRETPDSRSTPTLQVVQVSVSFPSGSLRSPFGLGHRRTPGTGTSSLMSPAASLPDSADPPPGDTGRAGDRCSAPAGFASPARDSR